MKIDITVKGNDIIVETLKKIKKIEQTKIFNDLQKDILSTLSQLKTDLLKIVNEDIKSEPIELPEGDEITISKSEEIIINEIFDINIDDIRKANDFETLLESNVSIITDIRGNKVTSVQINIEQGDSFSNHFNKALNFFNDEKTIFMFVTNGKVEYFINPGHDITEYVKIFCSTETGDTKESRHKFNLDEKNRDHTIWRLTDEGAQFIINNFTNVTDILTNIKEGKLNTAKIKLNNTGVNNQRIKDIDEKVDDIKSKDNIKDETLAHSELVNIINNLTVEKKTTGNLTTYSLISNVSGAILSNNDIFNKIQTNIAVWKALNFQRWVTFLRKRINSYLKSL